MHHNKITLNFKARQAIRTQNFVVFLSFVLPERAITQFEIHVLTLCIVLRRRRS